ncbi:MAG: pirin family protein [Actinomycetota bacterium]|jgi:quercetin 2,3-dioxygenase|nr:pirin family protein [Actinomycetota bacterium]
MADRVQQTFALSAQWPTVDPFLFVAHHHDDYPEGDGKLGPNADLAGRQLGQDFAGRDGWNMYHGRSVPGFPQHPHRGFETVTYVRRGHVDHADSLGATARFGEGDTQWMTAGAGIQHAEMFPLTDTDNANPLELFQIWLNLPAVDKMVDPYFTMLWSHQIPTEVVKDQEGRRTEVTVVAGTLTEQAAPTPPPNSWAARDEADVAIWHVSMESGATWTLPPAASNETLRVLYAFEGTTLTIDGAENIDAGHGSLVTAETPAQLRAGDGGIELMVLQGRPIGEPVAQHGPFVMNTQADIHEAYDDYQRTQFGGWPWPDQAPNHGPVARRFAVHADGRREDVS